jgi:hypothetical protein
VSLTFTGSLSIAEAGNPDESPRGSARRQRLFLNGVCDTRCHVTTTIEDSEPKTVYWHRELPPLEAELVAEHTVEANSSRVPGTIAHRDELWDQCYRELMANAESRLVREVARLGGHFAHVHDEAIDQKHDDASGEAWLHGRFSYMLYRRPQQSR